MALKNKYELLYREQTDVCGTPFSEFVAFAQSHSDSHALVLDLGCGQGRDALVFARCGMSVTGVDISPTGVEQMLSLAEKNDLVISGIVSDICLFETESLFDIVILDRTLHMLSDPNDRLEVLARCANWLTPNGHILIADEPSNLEAITKWFAADSRSWKAVPKMKRGFCFMQKSNLAP